MGTCGMLSIYKFMQLNSIRRSSKWSQSHEESSSYIHHACMNGKEADFKGQQTLKEYISSTARIDSAAANRLAIWFSAYIYKHTPNSSSPVRITTSSMCVQFMHKFCCKSNWVWLYADILLLQLNWIWLYAYSLLLWIELGMIVCIYSSVANQNWVYDCMIAYDCFEKCQGWDCGPGFAPAVHNFQQQLKVQHTCSSSLSAHGSSNSRINQPSQQLSLQKEMGCSLILCSKPVSVSYMQSFASYGWIWIMCYKRKRKRKYGILEKLSLCVAVHCTHV